jgi:hypothetical protein
LWAVIRADAVAAITGSAMLNPVTRVIRNSAAFAVSSAVEAMGA